MAEYRHLTITYPDGREVRTIARDEGEMDDLRTLQLFYGAKLTFGRHLKGRQLEDYLRLERERAARATRPDPAKQMKANFG